MTAPIGPIDPFFISKDEIYELNTHVTLLKLASRATLKGLEFRDGGRSVLPSNTCICYSQIKYSRCKII